MKALLEALSAAPGAMILAGGHSLLPALASRKTRSGHIIDVGRIAALKTIEINTEGTAVIGSGVSLSMLLASPVSRSWPALAQAIGFVGNHVVRNRATVGGSLAWADPRGELLLILIAHGAKVVTDRRVVDAASLVKGPFETILEPQELIIEVRVPPPPAIHFDEIMVRNSTGRATLSAACARYSDGKIGLFLGGLVDRPLHSQPQSCKDDFAFSDLVATFLESGCAQFPPLPDISSVEYRRSIAPRLLRRCFEKVKAL